ncbi:MAG: DUF2812 domain-containing protein [Lachnospiraceae bacterium]|nr:DUF2812 domain-containing protein [Lachnospiraceae bacterium]
MDEGKTVKTIRRLIPCPVYDVSGTECWLEEMAEQGWMLQEDGFFCGVATFEQSEACKVQYRLAAAKNSTSMWADNNGDPEEEELELNEAFGWKYVAKRGEFHVYRCCDPEGRELHTDKEVQVLAMNAMKSRQWDNLIRCFLWGIVYPYVTLHGNFMLAMVGIGTIPVGLMMLGVLFLVAVPMVNAVKLMRLRKKVAEGKPLGSGNGWRKGIWKHCAVNVLRLCAVVYAVVFLLTVWDDEIMREDYIPLTEYTGEVPFRTVEDLLPFGEVDLWNMGNMNTVREWSDILSPVNFEWNENGDVHTPDGARVYGNLDVMYHETRGEWIAKRLVREYKREGKRIDVYEPLELELPEMDEVVAFSSIVKSHHIILRKGEKVISASFYSTGEEALKPELSEWAKKMSESLYE